jgi:hypothetical protein
LLGSTLLAAGIIAALPFVFRFIANTARTLYSFNWNLSDAEIRNSLNSSISGLYSQLGEAAGTAVGWITCGILPGVVTFAFNPGVAKLVMADMTAEAQEEIWGSIAACQNSAIALLGRALLLNGYKSARRWLKRPDRAIAVSPVLPLLLRSKKESRRFLTKTGGTSLRSLWKVFSRVAPKP